MPANYAKRLNIIKNIIYAVLLILFCVLQNTPGLFVIAGVKPVLVLPLALGIAVYEGELYGAVYGVLAGLLFDMYSYTLFGFYGIAFCIACAGAGLLIIYLMKANLTNYLIFVLLTSFTSISISYLFLYGMWNYENAPKIFFSQTMPTIIYTTLSSVPIYYLVRKIHKKFSLLLD